MRLWPVHEATPSWPQRQEKKSGKSAGTTGSAAMSKTARQQDWTKPAAMAIPKGGYFKDKVQQGRYGPIFPKTPACYGFTLIARIKPGREEVIREYGKTIENCLRYGLSPMCPGRTHATYWRARWVDTQSTYIVVIPV
jgi:hypothetical protein